MRAGAISLWYTCTPCFSTPHILESTDTNMSSSKHRNEGKVVPLAVREPEGRQHVVPLELIGVLLENFEEVPRISRGKAPLLVSLHECLARN